MYDSGKIIIGLIVFLILMTFPIWFNAIAGKGDYVPDLEIKTINDPGRNQCVMEKGYMHPYHMDLLDEWRDDVVRNGERIHVSPEGKKYNRSLSSTCLDCHSNKDKFCDRCHDYMGVQPYCWECHLEPELMGK